MYRLLVLAVSALVANPACAQSASYEGPIALRTPARQAFIELQKDCPRMIEASEDLHDYFLHAGDKNSKSIYSDLSRAMGSDVVVVVTVHLPRRPQTIPAALIPRSGFTNLMMISGSGMSGVILKDPVALWLCDATPDARNPYAAKPSRGIGMALQS